MAKKKLRPEDLLILEVEEAQTKQGRPPIVDLAYAKVIAEWKGRLTKEDRERLKFFKLLLEVEAQAMKVQGDALLSTTQHSIVKRWGEERGMKWDTLTSGEQSTAIFNLCREKGTLKKVRDKFDEEGKPISGRNLYDIPDLAKFEAEVRKMILDTVLEDLKRIESEKRI